MSRFTNVRNIAVACVFAAFVLSAAAPAAAQGGVRAGVSVNPDQIYVGAHYETAPLVERLRFKPNVEVGFGDDVTAVAGNFEFVWTFPKPGEWGIYAGAGPAINHYAFDRFSSTDAGFNILFGVESTRGLAFEVKLGASDSPDVKFGVAWTFR